MHKECLSASELVRRTTGLLRSAPTATTDMRHTLARLTATTALTILMAECLLARGHGCMASMVETTTADGAATMVAGGAETVTDSAIAIEVETVAKVDGVAATDSAIAIETVAKADGTVAMDSAGTRASTVAKGPMIVVDSTAAATVEVSTAAVGTEEATDSCYRILVAHLNGWQSTLPAVFSCLSP